MWEQRTVCGRAYRDGRVVCGRVSVTILSVAPRAYPSPRQLRIRFLDDVDDDLFAELDRLIRARGLRKRRLAEQFEPLEIQWDDPNGPRSSVGRLDPPSERNAPLDSIDFRIRPDPMYLSAFSHRR
jgi:hypothetical protein